MPRRWRRGSGDECAIQLVAINGTPRYGTDALIAAGGPGAETIGVGGQPRVLYLKQATEDPDVAAIGYAAAQAKLADALHNIKTSGCGALDEFEHTDFTQRPHLRLNGAVTEPARQSAGGTRPPISSPALASVRTVTPGVRAAAGGGAGPLETPEAFRTARMRRACSGSSTDRSVTAFSAGLPSPTTRVSSTVSTT